MNLGKWMFSTSALAMCLYVDVCCASHSDLDDEDTGGEKKSFIKSNSETAKHATSNEESEESSDKQDNNGGQNPLFFVCRFFGEEGDFKRRISKLHITQLEWFKKDKDGCVDFIRFLNSNVESFEENGVEPLGKDELNTAVKRLVNETTKKSQGKDEVAEIIEGAIRFSQEKKFRELEKIILGGYTVKSNPVCIEEFEKLRLMFNPLEFYKKQSDWYRYTVISFLTLKTICTGTSGLCNNIYCPSDLSTVFTWLPHIFVNLSLSLTSYRAIRSSEDWSECKKRSLYIIALASVVTDLLYVASNMYNSTNDFHSLPSKNVLLGLSLSSIGFYMYCLWSGMRTSNPDQTSVEQHHTPLTVHA